MVSAVVCIARDEEEDIAEWVTYHKAIGFDHVILYNHLSKDRTGEVAQAAGAEVLPWSELRSPQGLAYIDALNRFGSSFEWLAFLDSDEFFVPEADLSVPKFLERMSPFSAVAVNWRCYGSSGHMKKPKGLITDNFLWRGADSLSANHHVKAFIRPDKVSHNVNPHYFEMKDAVYVYPNGKPVEWTIPGKTKTIPKNKIARVNHYYTRSYEHYQIKLKRPSATKGHMKTDEFTRMDVNDVYDPVIVDLFGDLLSDLRSNTGGA